MQLGPLNCCRRKEKEEVEEGRENYFQPKNVKAHVCPVTDVQAYKYCESEREEGGVEEKERD